MFFSPLIKRRLASVLPPLVVGRLRSSRISRSIAHYTTREVTHLYGGRELKIWLSDPLAEGWYDHDWPILPEIALLASHRLQPGARVFDIGAHQGVVALMLQGIVGESGFVLAVEANAHNAAIALRNALRNGATSLSVVNVAAGRVRGTIGFNEMLNGQVDGGDGAFGHTQLSCRTVDDLASEFGHPDLLFVDVEGYECEVLAGASETLARRPDVFVEVHAGVGLEDLGGSVDRVLTAFPEEIYDRYIGFDDGRAFCPLSGDNIPASRFFLVAVTR